MGPPCALELSKEKRHYQPNSFPKLGERWDKLSVSSVKEKPPQRFSSALSLTEGAFYFSQKNTEEQISQRPTETLSQPITQNVTTNRSLTPSPSPNGEGSDYRSYPYLAVCVVMGLWGYPNTSTAIHQHLTIITKHPPRLIINTYHSSPNTHL